MSSPEVKSTEKKALVSRMLKSRPFQKADRARAVLSFLLECHLLESESGPNQTTIYERLWEKDRTTFEAKNDAVRSQIARLRGMLSKYFDGEGRKEALKLTIISGDEKGYRLNFQSVDMSISSGQGDALRNWFWGAYLRGDDPIYFGCLPEEINALPDDIEDGHEYEEWALRIYSNLAICFAATKKLDIYWKGWLEDTYHHEFSLIVVGDDQSFNSEALHFIDSMRFENFASWEFFSRFPMAMLRTSGKTMIVNPKGSPQAFVDSTRTNFVLLTRLTTPDDAEQTLLHGASRKCIEKVTQFITSSDGLLMIQALPELRERAATLKKMWEKHCVPSDSRPQPIYYAMGAPSEFQIAFAVTTAEREHHSVEIEEEDVRIVACAVPELAKYEWGEDELEELESFDRIEERISSDHFDKAEDPMLAWAKELQASLKESRGEGQGKDDDDEHDDDDLSDEELKRLLDE